jgi:hypothetical protein
MGCAASRAWFTKAVGSLTDAKPVVAWGMVLLLNGAFCAIVVALATIRLPQSGGSVTFNIRDSRILNVNAA